MRKTKFLTAVLFLLLIALILTGCGTRYTVTFDSQQGSPVATQNVIENKKAKEPSDPTRDNYIFGGWYTSAQCSEGEEYDFTAEVTGNITLYAKWTTQAEKYAVTFNSQGGGDITGYTNVESGSKITQPSNPSKTGYTFGGWYKESSCTNVWTFASDQVTANITLYAKWNANNNAVVFDKNATDASGTMTNQTIATSATAALTSNAFERAGYDFAGWATSASGEIVFADGANYAMGTGASYTLYAVWNPKNSVVVFNKNTTDATGTMTNQMIATDATAALTLNAFEREGYDFAGWATSADGEVAYLEGANYTMGIENSYTLYAVWNANNNAVVFDKNATDAKGTMTNQMIATDATAALTLNAFERENYTFAGWATTADGEVAYLDGANYTMGTGANYTLYAKWDLAYPLGTKVLTFAETALQALGHSQGEIDEFLNSVDELLSTEIESDFLLEFCAKGELRILLTEYVGKTFESALVARLDHANITAAELDELFDILDDGLSLVVSLVADASAEDWMEILLNSENVGELLDIIQRLAHFTTPEKLAVMLDDLMVFFAEEFVYEEDEKLAEFGYDLLIADAQSKGYTEVVTYLTAQKAHYEAILEEEGDDNENYYKDMLALLRNYDRNALLIKQIVAIVDVIADENPQDLINFFEFIISISQEEGELDITGYGSLSYNDIVEQINYLGDFGLRLCAKLEGDFPLVIEKLIQTAVDAIATLRNAKLSSIIDYELSFVCDNEWLEETLKENGQGIMSVFKLTFTVLSNLTAEDLANFYMDIMEIEEAELDSEMAEAISIFSVRIADILYTAYGQLSTSEQVALIQLMDDIIEAFNKWPTVVEGITLTAADIFDDLQTLTNYDADELYNSADILAIWEILDEYINMELTMRKEVYLECWVTARVGITQEEILDRINKNCELEDLEYTFTVTDIKNWDSIDLTKYGETYLYIEFTIDGKDYYATVYLELIDISRAYPDKDSSGYHRFEEADPLYQYIDAEGNLVLTRVYSEQYYTDADGVRYYPYSEFTLYLTQEGELYVHSYYLNISADFISYNDNGFYAVYESGNYTYYDQQGNEIPHPDSWGSYYPAFVKVTVDENGVLTRVGDLFYTSLEGFVSTFNSDNTVDYYCQIEGDLVKPQTELTYHISFYYDEAIPVTRILKYYVDDEGNIIDEEEEEIYSEHYYEDLEGNKYDTDGFTLILYEDELYGYGHHQGINVYFWYYYDGDNAVVYYEVYDNDTDSSTYYSEAGTEIDKPDYYSFGSYDAFIKVTVSSTGEMTRVDNLFYTDYSGFETSFSVSINYTYYKQIDSNLVKPQSDLTYHTYYYYGEDIPLTEIEEHFVDEEDNIIDKEGVHEYYYYEDSEGVKYYNDTKFVIYETADGKYVTCDALDINVFFGGYTDGEGRAVGVYRADGENDTYIYYDEAGNEIEYIEGVGFYWWAFVKVTVDENGVLTRADDLFYTNNGGFETSFAWGTCTYIYYHKQVGGDVSKPESELTAKTTYYYNKQCPLSEEEACSYGSLYVNENYDVYFVNGGWEWLKNIECYGVDELDDRTDIEFDRTDAEGNKYFIYYIVGDTTYGRVAIAVIVYAGIPGDKPT